MNNGIFIIAHAPLASALRQCVLHVFPDAASSIAVFDVMANMPSDETVVAARMTMKLLNKPQVLVCTDLFGATPCNVAQKLVDGINSRLIAGVNLPMLLRAVTYRNESLDALVTRAVAGGTQGVMQVAVTAPQNQTLKPHDKNNHDHQQ
jgi:PTS system ascorbate-specific IIA component